MAREGLTPTPSRDLDVFGKELPLTSAEKQILTGEQTIFLKKALSIEIATKKGETLEPRVLVISSSKCFLLSHKPVAKLETSFNFLHVQKLECTEKTLTFHLSRELRPLKLHLDRKDSVVVLGLITAQLKNVFPVTPLEVLIQTVFTPTSLRDDTMRLRDSLLGAMDRLDPASLHGFITAYGFLCDFFSVSFSEEVTWYLKNVYLTHGFRDLKLHDFNHLTTKEVRPIVSALRHNEFFEGIIEKDNKTEVELLEEIGYALNSSRSIKSLVLHNCSLKPDNVIRLSLALKNNPKPSLTHLDLSHNILDDKAMESLGSALESLTHGLHDLRLANCKITARAATQLANAMMANKLMQHSLVHLDLSSNPLGPDPQGSLGFLKEPQTVATLKLSNCGLSFEFVTPVLIRGCQQYLRDLDLSHNTGRSKRGGAHGSNVATQLKQFCSSAISIATINLSGCKISGEMTVGLLEGLCVNPNVQKNIELNLSGNDLGSGRDPRSVAKVIAKTSCLEKLYVSESGIDGCLVAYIGAVRVNRSITHLSIGKNFGGKGNSRASALKVVSQFLSSSDCHLRSLSLADSHLREQTATILEPLATNSSLTKLDISGNGMGNYGARSLAKALLSNCRLREVIWDHNDTSLHGFRDVAASMEHNYTLRMMPLPLHDIGKAAAREPQDVEAEVQKMQVYLCRNHSDERLKIELAARHRQRLLTATQQIGVVSRELVQLEDLLKWSERGLGEAEENEGAEIIAEALLVRDEANTVVQLTDGLYSPHVETEQFESVSSQVAELLEGLMGRLHQQHIQENSEQMVSQSVKACPSLLSDKDRNLLRKLVVTEMGSEFDVARKTVVHKVVPEIINPISASNLDLAATISEHLVEKTLVKLEKINSKLIKLQKALQKKTSSGTTPDQKVSRAFTFRVEGEDQPKVTRRRPLSTDSDIVDLPSSPLASEAPQLEHVSKSRPRPARLQKGGSRKPHKPAYLSKAKDEVDIGYFVQAVKDAEQNSARLAAEERKAATVAATTVRTAPVMESNTVTVAATKTAPVTESKTATVAATKTAPVTESADTAEPPNEDKTKEEVIEDEEEIEPAEDNDSGEKEEEKEKKVVEKSPPTVRAETKPTGSSPRSPPRTPPPSPPPSTHSPPLITTPMRKEESLMNDNADESSSSLETVPKREASPSPSDENSALTRDHKKSRKEMKKEEKEKKEREKEEREREKHAREERERLKKEKEREEKEKREREEREREKRAREERERLRKEKEREEKEKEKERERKEKEEREREKRTREERERLRKEKEREEKERERREREEREREKLKKAEKDKGQSSEDLLTVNGGRDEQETSPGAGSRSIEKRKYKSSVKETRKKSGLSKLFGRPKGKEEGDEEGTTSDPETIDFLSDLQPHKAPRQQMTTPKKKKDTQAEEERTSTTPEPLKRVPPRVKGKPVKSRSVDFGIDGRGEEWGGEGRGGEGGGGEVGEGKKRPVGGVPAMPLPGLAASQLTNVLKPRPSPQPRSKPTPTSSSGENSPALSERTQSESTVNSSPLTSHKTPPIAPRPRPKPKTKPRKVYSAMYLKEQDEEADLERPVPKKPPKPASRSATPTVSPDQLQVGEGEGGKGGGSEEDKEGTEKGGEGKEGEGEGEGKEKGTSKEPPEDKQGPDPSDNQEANEGTPPFGDGDDSAQPKRSQSLV